MLNCKWEMANAVTSLFDVTDVIVHRGAVSWDQERSHQITHPPSVGLLCLVMFQTRNGGLNTVTVTVMLNVIQ